MLNVLGLRTTEGKVDEDYRFVQLGQCIMEKFDAKEWQSRIALGVYGGLYTIRHPVRGSLRPLLTAHRSGLVVGDVYVSKQRKIVAGTA